MGWFTNSDKEEPSNEDNKPFFDYDQFANTSSKVCRLDPEDANYMICKTTTQKRFVKDGKPQTTSDEKEERVPVNQYADNTHQSMSKGAQFRDALGQNGDFSAIERTIMGPLEEFLKVNNEFFGTFFPGTVGRNPEDNAQNPLQDLFPFLGPAAFGQRPNNFYPEYDQPEFPPAPENNFSQQPQQPPKEGGPQRTWGPGSYQPPANRYYGYRNPDHYDFNFSKNKKNEKDIIDL